jgi:hypothetical protein
MLLFVEGAGQVEAGENLQCRVRGGHLNEGG